MTTPAYPPGARYFYMVSFEIDPADEALFNEIYETEHIPNILTVPGVLGVVRFRDHEPNERGWLFYSALYYLTEAGLPDTPQWQAESDKGRWAPLIRPRVKSRQRRLGRLAGTP
ncbi:hypothetical protein GCM10023144_15270 [Pigmentiphaga soli]|uniref:Uncharacterized protein n=1 Tax=Pigmentiphaga soli TaxID=1007095 RepID=A0ABP8GRS6_9BURK